jgi:flavin reductase (DIM6/NTAB) family NADH-FMN oxidoreductase RutF
MNDFTNAMRRAVSGVSIVTTNGESGRYGLTVSSMTSVSAEPPTLLVCVNRNNLVHDAIANNRRFAINVLGSGHRALAASFAGSSEHGPAYDFDADEWLVTASGLPRIADAAAIFECVLDRAVKVGTHSIFIGRVERSRDLDILPLAYSNREYRVPLPLDISATITGTKSVLEAATV